MMIRIDDQRITSTLQVLRVYVGTAADGAERCVETTADIKEVPTSYSSRKQFSRYLRDGVNEGQVWCYLASESKDADLLCDKANSSWKTWKTYTFQEGVTSCVRVRPDLTFRMFLKLWVCQRTIGRIETERAASFRSTIP